MTDKTVEQIYDIHKRLHDAGDSISSETGLFSDLIAAAHSPDNTVKLLVAQELPKYIHIFPTLADQALSAQMDLLEDDETKIRIRAIRGVELICKNAPARTRHLGELIGQLLTAESQELAAVKLTLSALFNIDTKETFSALFTQMKEGDAPLREKVKEFLISEMTRLNAEKIATNEDTQKHLGDEIKKVLLSDQVTTLEELKSWLTHLRNLKSVTKDASYGTDMTNILVKYAGLDKPFDPTNDIQIQQYLSGLQHMGGYAKFNVDNGLFLTYFATRIVHVFDTLSAQHKLDLLKSVAYASKNATPKTAKSILPAIVDVFHGIVRPGDKSEMKEEKELGISQKLPWVQVECLLYIYHQLATKAPDTVREVSGIFIPTGQPSDFSGDASKREAFVTKLNYVLEQAKLYETQVKEHQKTLKNDKSKPTTEEEKKAKAEKWKVHAIAARTGACVQKLVQSLLGKEPTFLSSVRLSVLKPLDKKKAGTGTTPSTKGKPQQGTKRKGGQASSNKQGGTGSQKRQKGQQQQQQQQQPQQNKKRKSDGGASSNKKQRTTRDQTASSAPAYSGQPGETIVKREPSQRGGSASHKRGGSQKGRGGRGGQQQQSRPASSQKRHQNGGGQQHGGQRPVRGGATGGRGGGRGRGGRGRGGRGRGRR